MDTNQQNRGYAPMQQAGPPPPPIGPQPGMHTAVEPSSVPRAPGMYPQQVGQPLQGPQGGMPPAPPQTGQQQPSQPAQQAAGPTVTPPANKTSTQNALEIAEIRDGIVIMNDGSFRTVVMCQSINFDLMAADERESVEFSYQGFLNSLYFDIQIFIRSQRVDLRPYLKKLDRIRSEHDNMLLALLMEDYIGYMSVIAQQSNIMDKKFYVVIDYRSAVTTGKAVEASKGFFSTVLGKKSQHVIINEAELEAAKTELRNRIQTVMAGLQQCGVNSIPLDTEELIELYYDAYNPDTATRQKLNNFHDLATPVVTKGKGMAPQASFNQELV